MKISLSSCLSLRMERLGSQRKEVREIYFMKFDAGNFFPKFVDIFNFAENPTTMTDTLHEDPT